MRAQAAFPFLFCTEVKTMARHRGTDVRYVLKVEWLLGDPDSEHCYNGIMLSVPQTGAEHSGYNELRWH